MTGLKIRVERLREEQIGDIVALSFILVGIITEKKLKRFLTQVMYMAYGMREKN